MNPKLLYGVGVPVVLLLLLAILSSSDIGLTTTTDTVEEIPRTDLFNQNYAPVSVQWITVNNDFFLPRSYQVPSLTACVRDKDGGFSTQTFTIKYSKGQPERSVDLDDILFGSRWDKISNVEVGSYATEIIQVYVTSRKLAKTETIDDYNELLLFEDLDYRSSYYACRDLSPEDINSATAIPLT